MKKIWVIIAFALLIGGSYYTVNNYQKEKEKDEVTTNLNSNTKTDSINVSDAENDTKNVSNLEDDTKNVSNSQTDTNANKEKAIDFTLKDLEGNEVSLSDLKGKKVFLNFWATWCPPCKAEMPEIEKLYQETKDSDLVIIAVEIGEPAETVNSFIKDNGIHFRVLLDTEQSVAVEYNISSIPTSYFIDEEGNIVSQVVGGLDLSQMKSYVDGIK